MIATVAAARNEFAALCAEVGSDPIAEETAILSVGREFLPACAVAVLDDPGAATVDYYEWLCEQTRTAQAEHDAEVAAGHEWHQ